MNNLVFALFYITISCIIIIVKSIIDKSNGVDNSLKALTMGAFWPITITMWLLMYPGILFRRLYKYFNK